MKRHLISYLILTLLILSIFGIVGLLIRENMRTPTDYWELAQAQLAEKNYPAALRNLTKAADGNIPIAQYQLALLYDTGDKIPENKEKAIFYMKAAAEKNYRDALYVMGVWTERGYFGRPNTKTAVAYYLQAAKMGHTNAMRSLIARYSEGFGGFPNNLREKTYWIHKLIKMENRK